MIRRQNIAVPSPTPKYPAPYPYGGLISPYECAIVSYRRSGPFDFVVSGIEINFRRVCYRLKGRFLYSRFERDISKFVRVIRGDVDGYLLLTKH